MILLPDDFIIFTEVGFNGYPDKKIAMSINKVQYIKDPSFSLFDINELGEVTSLHRLRSDMKLTTPTKEGILTVLLADGNLIYVKGKL